MTAGSSFASTSQFTHTYSITKASTFPAQLISDLTKVSHIPVVLPRNLPQFQPPYPTGYRLAVVVDASPNEYGLDIFWRNTNTSHFDDSEFVTGIEASKHSPTTIALSPSQHGIPIKLSGGVSAIEYRHPSYGQIITWNKDKWTFIALDAPEVANLFAKDMSAHGVLIRNVKKGYVEMTQASRPQAVIRWTYDGQIWYSFDAYDVPNLIKECRHVAIYRH
jgi:hypothetical protein